MGMRVRYFSWGTYLHTSSTSVCNAWLSFSTTWGPQYWCNAHLHTLVGQLFLYFSGVLFPKVLEYQNFHSRWYPNLSFYKVLKISYKQCTEGTVYGAENQILKGSCIIYCLGNNNSGKRTLLSRAQTMILHSSSYMNIPVVVVGGINCTKRNIPASNNDTQPEQKICHPQAE